MGNGKIFCLIGGIMTLVATFILGFVSEPILGNAYFGIGFLMNMDNVFEDTASFSVWFGGLDFVVYIIFVVLIVFLISGFIQLAGIKKRIAAIIGSLFPIFISLVFISSFYDALMPDPVSNIFIFFSTEIIVEGVVPLHVPVGTIGVVELSLGTYILLGGGVLGLIGGIIGVE
jgi:hypothetical protein